MPKNDAEITLAIKSYEGDQEIVIKIDDDAKMAVVYSATRALVERIVGAHSNNAKIEIKAIDD
jgi:hypothetical protein